MLADLDLSLIVVFCAADDLPSARPRNATRSLTDAEVVTLCVAQLMGIASDEPFLRVARKRLTHLLSPLPRRSSFRKRRAGLADMLEAMISQLASESPGFPDDLVLVDADPVECARSIETTRRSLARGRRRLRLLRRPQPLLLGHEAAAAH